MCICIKEYRIHLNIFKENQLVANKFCITDMGNLVSIP